MKICKKEKHNDDIRLIFAQQGFCSNQSGGPKYDGEFFTHCPFCGELLVEEKAEQGVLTVDEIIKSVNPFQIDNPADFCLPLTYVVEAVKKADKNGQLRERLNCKEHINALRDIIHSIQNSRTAHSPGEVYCDMSFHKERIDGIAESLKDIKPLE